MKKKPIEIVLSDFPEAKRLLAADLITERSAEIYAIRKRYEEIKDCFPTLRDCIEQIETEFPKSDRTIYRYIRTMVIK